MNSTIHKEILTVHIFYRIRFVSKKNTSIPKPYSAKKKNPYAFVIEVEWGEFGS